MPDNPKVIPPVRAPETEGLPHKRRDEMNTDKGGAPVNPDTSGEAPPSADPLKDPFAERRSDAPDQANVTPRPTDNPIDE
ncbi:MAG TPA: hypothetical protein VNS34_05680 [Rhizobiaceae bacterium]|nr:hypothetical protein [Rhizobiaceae bacterium]